MAQRDSSVHRPGATASRIPRVAIIGGGTSGKCVAVSLVRQRLRDVVIFEKAQSYRDVVQRDDVEITGAIDRIDASGVTMADRTRHELDVLILATGFDTLAYMRPMRVQAAGT